MHANAALYQAHTLLYKRQKVPLLFIYLCFIYHALPPVAVSVSVAASHSEGHFT